jgi:hypothetical protein
MPGTFLSASVQGCAYVYNIIYIIGTTLQAGIPDINSGKTPVDNKNTQETPSTGRGLVTVKQLLVACKSCEMQEGLKDCRGIARSTKWQQHTRTRI